MKNLKICIIVLILGSLCAGSYGQGSVPFGIYYQAVARDNSGKEIANKEIDVRFSIFSENPLGTLVYQELHSKIITSRYGVFSLTIGHGTPTGGLYPELSQVTWSTSLHYLKVEVKFESTFLDMGTMQFLAVPYALYAQKSLEPGPQGLKGDPGPIGLQGIPGIKGDRGDPATDDQTLSFNGNNLSISGGNTVNLSTLNIPHQLTILGSTLSIMGGNEVDLPNQIQDLQLDVNNKLKISKNTSATEIDLTKFLDDKQQLNFNSVNNSLTITGGNIVDLTPLKNDADADPANEIQDLSLGADNKLVLSKSTSQPIDFTRFLDDKQQLTFTPADNKLEIAGGNIVDLTPLKNDADADPANEIQDLSFDAVKRELRLSKSTGSVIDLTELKNDADADPTNEIQDLSLTGNTLTITNKVSPAVIDLTKYLQQLTFTPADNKLEIAGGNIVDLTALKNDADADPANEIQDLSFNAVTRELNLSKSSALSINLSELKNDADADPNNELQTLSFDKSTGSLTISSKVPISLLNPIGFKAKKSISQTGLITGTTYSFINSEVEFNEGLCYDSGTGSMTAIVPGIYTFFITYKADGTGSGRQFTLLKNGLVYEILGPDISSNTEIIKWVTMKLDEGNVVSLTINTGMSTNSGTGSFIGYKVN